MFNKGSKLYSILWRKCPRCHEGELFTHRNPYNFKLLGKMPAHCPRCDQSFSPEPGFYFGASYISYGLTIVIGVTILLFNYFFVKAPLENLLYIIIGAVVVLAPVVYVLSRSTWINIFVKYDEAVAKSVRQNEKKISS